MSPVEPLKEVPAQQVDAPNIKTVSIIVPASTAASTDLQTPFVASLTGLVTSVVYTPSGNITGEATNNRTLSLVNKGSAGGGSTVVATRTTTVGLVGMTTCEIPVSTEEAAVKVVAGEVLDWRSIHNSSGCIDPGGELRVQITRRLVTMEKQQPGV